MKIGELTDKEYRDFLSLIDKATRSSSFERAIIGALVIAAGGRVKLTPTQITDVLEGNLMYSAERVGMDFEIRAAARPRCEKCGRWERHD